MGKNLKSLLVVLFFSNLFLYSQHHSQIAVLPNGNFIQCGGDNLGRACEVYVSSKSAWMNLGDILSVYRTSHTLNILPDGRVIVIGGSNASGSIQNTIDILSFDYDNGGSYSEITTVNMLSARANHTSTLLSKGVSAGNVLICGGQTAANTTTDTCEIFITTATAAPYTVSGPTLSSRRQNHTANLLPSGNVLFVGGFYYNGVTPSYNITTDIYYQENNTITPGPSIPLLARAYHTATTLSNGNTIIIGGYNAYNAPDLFSWEYSNDRDAYTAQQQGTRGYLENMIVLDENGSIVPIGNSDYQILPYRVSNHTSVLYPSGKVFLVGGRGNIPVTYYEPSIELNDSTMTFTSPAPSDPTGNRTVGITGGYLNFNQTITLSRNVTGRIIDGDVFFGEPSGDDPVSISVDNIRIYLKKTTAPLDGVMVGYINDQGIQRGIINNANLTLDNPSLSAGSYAIIEALNGLSIDSTPGILHLYFSTPLDPGEIANLQSNSTAYILLNINLPAIYAGYNVTQATITLNSATFEDDYVSVTLTGGNAEITSPVPVNNDGTLSLAATFYNLSGTVTNSTETAISSYPYVNSGSLTDLELNISFNVDGVNIPEGTSLTVGGSTIVIRDMIFSDISHYIPSTNNFDFEYALIGEDVLPSSPYDFWPVFDHNTIISNTGSVYVKGGQNCESNPTSNCRRSPNTTLQPVTSEIPYNPLEPNWANLPEMKEKRAYHTSTVLNNGSILVCGGSNGAKTLDNCETFSPQLDSWVIISTMTTPRAYHTATLLPNGTVLIAGGQSNTGDANSVLNTSEIYYPSTKKFVKAGDMNYPRMLHTATLLPDGNVLVTGGVGNGSYLNTAEIFITTANIWIPVSNMNDRRSEHTATLLKNGNVLITGGLNGNGILNTSEIFDFSNYTFTAVGNMNEPRKRHTANLLKNGRVIVIGGHNSNYVSETMEIFDPNTNSWSFLTSPTDDPPPPIYIAYPRTGHKSLTLPNGNILTTGGAGLSTNEIVRNSAELINNEFIRSKVINTSIYGNTDARIGHTVLIATNNYILTIGGFDGAYNYLNTAKAIYFESVLPDKYSKESLIPRKPTISSVVNISTTPDTSDTVRADRGDKISIISNNSNLHSLTEASGGGSGPQNNYFAKPNIYLKSINDDFMIDLSTQLFDTNLNTSWETTLSTITLTIPQNPSNVPYGWYYLYDCIYGICSDPYIIQISTPRPQCSLTNVQAQTATSSTTIVWNWQLNSYSNANGFGVFDNNDVFITTVPFPSPISAPTTFYHTNLKPNTPSSLKVRCYNIGGFSYDYASATSTIYTLANPPINLTVTYASYDTVKLKWDSNGNTDDTPYQLEISTYSNFATYSTVISFTNNYTKTDATVSNLSPNTRYYFRVKAANGNGIETYYDTQVSYSSTYNNPVSTITVGIINNLNGTPLSQNSIAWSWDESSGATFYEIYSSSIEVIDEILKTTAEINVLLTTTSFNTFIQTFTYVSGNSIALSTNTAYKIKVRAVKNDSQTGGVNVYGPFATSPEIYTLSAEVAPGQPAPFGQVSTGSFKVTWDSNGNPEYTTYLLEIGADSSFSSILKSYTVSTDSATYPTVSYTVTGLKPNYQYCARVYAKNKAGNLTDPVSMGCKWTLAQPVSNVEVTDITLDGVTLTWNTGDNSPYTIYEVRATSVGFTTPYISTPVPFSYEYTDNTVDISGLATKTSYYFDVAARNMEGISTSRIQTTQPAITLGGPNNAPPGSIAGLTNPNSDTTITGVLQDGRTVTLNIPKNSFLTEQPIAVASLISTTTVCQTSTQTFGGYHIIFGVYANEQPYEPITFTFSYNSSEANEIRSNKTNLTLARYNPSTGQCLPVETEINTSLDIITAKLNHFSIYQLILYNPSEDLSNVKIYPNPFYPNRSGQGNITIINLPKDSNIKIYTLSGIKVYETKANSIGIAYWDGKNSYGQYVGSGIYLAVVKSSRGKKILKIAIER